LVEACATARGIPAADIEKDVWVVEALRSVFRPVDRATVVFKGGTSLSKAYGIIERFSEDVDLLVVPDAGLGRSACDRIRLLGDASVLNALGDTAFAERIAADAHHRAVAAGWPSIPRPSGGFATSPAFIEGTDAAQAFSLALVQAAALVWGDRPTFGDVQARVREDARLL
jgi:hypothetical protein